VSPNLASDEGREALIRGFLKANGFAELRRERMAGDASTRSYERLHRPGGGSLILMNQPPQHETAPCPPGATPEARRALGYNASARLAAGRVDAFVATAGYLKSRGLSAPEVLALDVEEGLAVLEDLGDELVAVRVARGEAEAPMYEAAVDALVRLHAEPPPATLEGYGASWPLLTYDDLGAGDGVRPVPELVADLSRERSLPA
jgi:aminoglycoside/choline kinase family phosphotransferase